MTANQLWRQCGAIPEYGTIRRFKLQGMLLTFRFTNLQWSSEANRGQPKLQKFTFEVSAVPDKNAETSNAATLKVSAPPKFLQLNKPPG
jgi:hypothetical protein